MNRYLIYILSFLLSVGWFADANPPPLTPYLTRRKAEAILKDHAIYKNLSPELMRRVLRNYVGELDEGKTYLLQGEVTEWESPSDALLAKAVRNYRRGDFSLFGTMYETMIGAIRRRARLEKEVRRVQVDPADFKDMGWARTEEELRERLAGLHTLRSDAAEKWNAGMKERIILRCKKHRLSREREIVQNSQEGRRRQQLTYFLKAFASALDSHTTYFTPGEAKRFLLQVQQRLFGIGAELQDDFTGLIVVRLVEGGPAFDTGEIGEGDRIIAVNGEPVVGMDFINAVESIRGPKGTSVVLTILKAKGKGEERREVTIVRDEITTEKSRFAVNSIPYGEGTIGHIRLFSFYQSPDRSSSGDLRSAIEKMKSRERVRGIVLDLRGNAGGLLPQAVAVTGLFIRPGIVSTIKEGAGRLRHLRHLETDPVWEGPLIVLTDKASASAAEITAQTLQDYGRAVLVGDATTWGKGSYQTFTLDHSTNTINPQGEYKVTRGLYYTVSGKSPQLTGAIPDIVVPGCLSCMEIGEAYARFPLRGDAIAPGFDDALSDVHPLRRRAIRSIYEKSKQGRIPVNVAGMDILRENSATRTKNDARYRTFLKEIGNIPFDRGVLQKYRENDLQLDETIHIMRDLIFLADSARAASAPVA